MLVPKDIKGITAINQTIAIFKVPVGKEPSAADTLTANIYGVGSSVKLADQRKFDYHVKVLRPAMSARQLHKGVHILDTPTAVCKTPAGLTEGDVAQFTSGAQILQGTVKINDTVRYNYWDVTLMDLSSGEVVYYLAYDK